jgi:signal transduction histidine kinase
VAGPAFGKFTSFLKQRLLEVEQQVEQEISQPRWEKSRQAKTKEIIAGRYHTLSVLSLGLAHELRQPLQSIQTATDNIVDRIKAKGLNEPHIDKAADVIRRNVSRIDKHITFLKDIGSGNIEPGADSFELIDLDQLIGEVVDAFQERCQARAIALSQSGTLGLKFRFNRSALLSTPWKHRETLQCTTY